MRTFTLLLVLVFCTLATAQPVKKGIVDKRVPPYQIGDTISVFGIRQNPPPTSFLYPYSKTVWNFIPQDRIRLLEDNFSFWENAWFEQRMSIRMENSWPMASIAALDESSLTYISRLHESDVIIDDDLLNDYLLGMLLRIHPDTLIKSRARSLHVWIIHSLRPEIFSLDNGAVILSTGLLCRVESEWELENALARQVAHIVLDHQLVNFTQSPGPITRGQGSRVCDP